MTTTALPERPIDALAPVVLRDGTQVRLHAMRAGDAPALRRFHGRLSPETTYLRFFTVHPELSDDELHRFTHVDHHDREAIVATVGRDIVGVARFDRIGDSTTAEAAFVVADLWQGEGLGRALFERLALRARSLGVEHLEAEVLPHNRRMLGVLLHAGLPASSRIRDGVAHVRIDLAVPEPGGVR